MAQIFDKRENATEYEVQSGDNLNAIARQAGLDDWRHLAHFNWGSFVNDEELSRAVHETIGAPLDEAVDPGAQPLRTHADAKRKLKLPKLLALEGLAQHKTHKVTVKKIAAPVAIVIKRLPKWFIPKHEDCTLRYELQGSEDCADKVEVEIHGSNYCEVTDYNDGFGSYAVLDNEPVYKKLDGNPAHERSEQVFRADSGDAWRGEASTAAGLLAVKNPDGERYVNVAFSPYTVGFRYFHSDTSVAADKTARIVLHPFWPQFDAAGRATAASMAIRWGIKDTERLAAGLLYIYNKFDQPVFIKPIAEARLAKSASLDEAALHSFTWDGAYNVAQADGKTHIDADDMPYRVQIQAHTGVGERHGLALAAMHTEVRLYMPDAATPPSDAAFDPQRAHQAMLLDLGEVVPGDPPAAGLDDTWFQYALAEAGYHPGPVTGTDAHDSFVQAMFELQRTVPKQAPAGGYERLPIDGARNPDTGRALNAIGEGNKRPWFGDSASRNDLTREQARLKLRTPFEEMIVWVDDRHYYTEQPAAWGMVPPELSMDNYRQGMFIKGMRQAMDGASTCRPWIPLKVTPLLLAKTETLGDAPNVHPVGGPRWGAMRRAIGPLRVDWTFDELGPDYSTIDTTAYDTNRARPRKYLEWALGDTAVTHRRPDTGRDATYTNCKGANGGTRGVAGVYFKQAIGHVSPHAPDGSLAPWKAKPTNVESIATVVHDQLDLGSDFFPRQMGCAGAYFNPSIIAGDGYRVRAHITFDECADYQFPNAKVLKARYQRPLHAYTCGLRNWRKSSVRAYSCWSPTPTGHWPGFMTAYNRHYHVTHCHFVQEGGNVVETPASTVFNPTDPADLDRYRRIIKSNCSKPEHQNPPDNSFEATMDPNHPWPWCHRADLGWPWPAPQGTGWDALRGDFIDVIGNATWGNYSAALIFEFVRHIEKTQGKQRGHTLVEFRSTPRYYHEEYACDGVVCQPAGNKHIFLEGLATGGQAEGRACDIGGCDGHMVRRGQYRGNYECRRCGDVHKDDDNPDGNRYVDEQHDCSRAFLERDTRLWGLMNRSPDKTKTPGEYQGYYRCRECKKQLTLAPDDATGARFLNQYCGHACDCGDTRLVRKSDPELIDAAYVGHYHCPNCGKDWDLPDNENNDQYAGKFCWGCNTAKMGKDRDKAPDPRPDGTFQGHYKCAMCAFEMAFENDSADGNRFGGASCASWCTCARLPLQPTGVTAVPKGMRAGGANLPWSAYGWALGATWLFYDTDATTWAHEVGHHRHFEHAASAPGANQALALHDSGPNSHVANWADYGESDPSDMNWDRACVMSYSSDAQYWCGKCILRNRGWRVVGLAAPASHERGP